MTFKLPDLPYAKDALEPHMSKETFEYHHGKHHATYVSKLNDAVKDTPMADWDLERVIHHADKEGKQGLFNNAAQHWNHSFQWKCFSPDGGGKPSDSLGRQIEADFGSYDDFAKKFTEAATGQFGSGWAWLVIEAGKLKVTNTGNADTPIVHGQHPLLTLDVWEHAYYIDHRNARPKYVETFLDKLVNWEFAAENFANQGEGNQTGARSYGDAQEAFAKKQKAS